MRQWGRASILAAIRQYVDIYGELPKSRHWNVAADLRPDWAPSTPTVTYWFGTWNNAIIAAGFVPRGRGKPRVQTQYVLSPNGKLVPAPSPLSLSRRQRQIGPTVFERPRASSVVR